MLAGSSLDPSEHQVPFAEGEWLDPLAVVVPELLLLDGRPAQGQLAGLLEEVDAVFSCFFCVFLRV